MSGVPKAPEVPTALVTGAAGTMGLAAARGLLADGTRVALADLRVEALESAVAQLAAPPGSV